MRVWLAHVGEPLPIDRTVRPFRYGVLAQMLASEGHEVTWWTSTFDHVTKKQRYAQNHTVDVGRGYRTNLLYSKGYSKNVSLARLRHGLKVARMCAQQMETEPCPDIILSSFPTPWLAAVAVDYGMRHKAPVIVDVRDLWPDAFLDLAPRGARWPMRLVLGLVFARTNRHIFRECTGIVAISASYLDWGLSHAQRQQRGTDGVFYMGYPRVTISDGEKREAVRRWSRRGLDGGLFLCCFFGTINRHFNLATVISAARELESAGEDRFRFVLCGTGPHLDRYRDLARGLKSVILPGWVNTAEVMRLMELSAVGLAPYAASATMSLPNKPFEYFAGGLPVISSLRGELEQTLADNQCGITYDANSPEDFSRALRELSDDPVRRGTMAGNASRLFEERFSADRTYPGMVDFLLRIASGDPGSALGP